MRISQCGSCGRLLKQGRETCRCGAVTRIDAKRPDPLGLSALDRTMRDLAKPDRPGIILPFRRATDR